MSNQLKKCAGVASGPLVALVQLDGMEKRKDVLKTTVLILPGIGNSGPDHWQSLWEKANPSFVRVSQRDWDHPVCAEWLEVLEIAVMQAGVNTILVAHSLACALVAHWAVSTNFAINGALLVAPPNPDGPNFPNEAVGFSPLPLKPMAFPSIVVASANDPYGSLEFAESAASAWGSHFVNIGPAGHINSISGLGGWNEGFSLLHNLLHNHRFHGTASPTRHRPRSRPLSRQRRN